VTKPRRHDCDERRAPHVCRPLAASSIRQCHAVLSSAYSAAVRWGWIAFNPMEAAQKPRLPTPDPGPPTSEEAARIVAAAWADDPDWGLLVWMLLVTGARRGEVLALRWINLDLATGILTIRHSVSEQGGAAIIKDTKTHQSRRISLDAATVALLIEHRQQVSSRCAELGTGFDEQRFVFSYQPDHSRPCSPSGVTHRYARMVRKLGIRTRLHSAVPLSINHDPDHRCRARYVRYAGEVAGCDASAAIRSSVVVISASKPSDSSEAVWASGVAALQASLTMRTR
jgi:integrase